MSVDRRGRNTAAIGEITRERILDVAERLFAEKGPQAVSTRAIAAAANANLSAMNYHFGTKERLFEQIFRRRMVPLNEQRLKMLDDAIAAAGPSGVPTIEDILTAFVTPMLRFSSVASGSARALVVMQFLAQVFSSPNEEAFLETYYEEVRTRFLDILRRACPALSIAEIVLRYNLVVGAITYAIGGPTRMSRLPRRLAEEGPLVPLGDEETIRGFVSFAAAGFREPPHTRKSGFDLGSTDPNHTCT